MGLQVTTRRFPARAGLGLDPQTSGQIGAGISTAGSITAASAIAAGAAAGSVVPVVGTIVGAIGGLIAMLLHAGYNPNKLNDTAVTEGVQIALHQLWYQLTGEDLGMNCTPGKCGDQHVAIFTTSQYPDVPQGADGNPGADPAAFLAAAQRVIADGRAKLIRPESFSDYDNNTNYMLGLFNSVLNARQQDNPVGAGGLITDVQNAMSQLGSGSAWPWLLLGGAVLWALA